MGTLPTHVESGEQRFIIEWNKKTNNVYIEVISFSQPQQWFTKLGYPVARSIQKHFADASLDAFHLWLKNSLSNTTSPSLQQLSPVDADENNNNNFGKIVNIV
jgi:hypothetical protein